MGFLLLRYISLSSSLYITFEKYTAECATLENNIYSDFWLSLLALLFEENSRVRRVVYSFLSIFLTFLFWNVTEIRDIFQFFISITSWFCSKEIYSMIVIVMNNEYLMVWLKTTGFEIGPVPFLIKTLINYFMGNIKELSYAIIFLENKMIFPFVILKSFEQKSVFFSFRLVNIGTINFRCA